MSCEIEGIDAVITAEVHSNHFNRVSSFFIHFPSSVLQFIAISIMLMHFTNIVALRAKLIKWIARSSRNCFQKNWNSSDNKTSLLAKRRWKLWTRSSHGCEWLAWDIKTACTYGSLPILWVFVLTFFPSFSLLYANKNENSKSEIVLGVAAVDDKEQRSFCMRHKPHLVIVRWATSPPSLLHLLQLFLFL